MTRIEIKLCHAWVETVHGFFLCLFMDQFLWNSLHLHSEKSEQSSL